MVTKIRLPHRAPLRFARSTLEKTSKHARVLIEFGQIPSLPMLVEAAAQSSAAFRTDDSENAFLVSLKDIRLLQDSSQTTLEVEVVDEHRLENLRYVKFEVFEQNSVLAKGTLVIAVQ